MQRFIQRRQLLQSAAALAIPSVGGQVFAQDAFPSRPIKLLVAFPAGGPTDITMRALADKAIRDMTIRKDNVAAALDRNPILVTALNPVIGYEAAAAVAKRAYAEGRPVLEVACEDTSIPESELRRVLDPAALTRGGIDAAGG